MSYFQATKPLSAAAHVEGALRVSGGWPLAEEKKRSLPLSDIDLLHEIGSRMAAADPFHTVLERIIELVTDAVHCDSCFIYVLDRDQLVLRASKNPHTDIVDQVSLSLGQGIQ